EYFYGRIAQIPPRALTAMRALPDWTKQVRAVHTVLRELEAMARYELRPERFRTWNIPTLLLLGGESPPVYRAGIERMQAIVPGSALAVLEGQGRTTERTMKPAVALCRLMALTYSAAVNSEGWEASLDSFSMVLTRYCLS